MTSRTIRTAAELDAMSFRSVVREDDGTDWHKRRDGKWLCDDGTILTSESLFWSSQGLTNLRVDPTPGSPPVVFDAAVEALDSLVEACKIGVPEDVRRMVDDFAKDVRAGFAQPAQEASREEVAEVALGAIWSPSPYLNRDQNDARRNETYVALLDSADALRSRYFIIRKENDQ